jgi:hypothetical protein
MKRQKMIIIDYPTLCELPKGQKIWVVENPKAEIHSGLYTFNLTANINNWYPFNILERTDSDEVMFKKADGDKKTGYDFSILEVYDELRYYDRYQTHRYIVTTSEREILKEFKNSIIEFEETAKRALAMSQRFKKDTFGSKLLEEHQIQYPEDWI